MSIRFACEHCGHPFEVDDKLAGRKAHCKHCDQHMVIPTRSTAGAAHGAAADAGLALKLKPVEGLETPAASATPTRPGPALHVRPLAASEPAPEQTRRPDPVDERPIQVLDPYHFAEKQARRPWLNPHYETRIARMAARFLRTTRDRLYLLSLAFLVMTLIGFLFKLRVLLHLGTIGTVASNALMLVDGFLYLMVVPFKESLAQGIGATIFPPYHWIRHWDRMRGPFLGTVRSFVPVLLAGVVWFGYEEAPLILEEVEKVDRVVEKAIGVEPGSVPPAPQPRQPGVAEQARDALGGEARIIENLAQPN